MKDYNTINLPKVSIIIPVYNGSSYLKYAIDCALAQTYPKIEVIVVNDGSNDDGKTEAIALSYGNKIQYYSKQNGGVSTALNLGIQKMSGSYFSWLSHDDGYTPSKIEDSVKLLMKYNKIDEKCVAYSGGTFIDGKGQHLYPIKKFFGANRIYKGIEVIDILTKKGTLNGCCFLIPKRAFQEVGCFEEGLRYSQDSLMWYRLFLSNYELVYDDKQNVMSRIHSNQVTNTRRDLYEHDAKYIAKELAKPLYLIDKSGNLLCQYINRVSKYQCKEAIGFLLGYAESMTDITKQQLLSLRVNVVLGKVRYEILKIARQLLLMIRHD